MATNFDLAPPPVAFEGKVAVPIDIATVACRLRFEGGTSAATADATLDFVVGPAAGRPVFDLRQTITGVWLDGTPLTLAQVLTRNLGGGAGADLRVLDVALPAGSAHTLRLTYDLGPPAAPMGGSYLPAMTWAVGPRLSFNFGFTDLSPGRYLESWVPANLIWDQFAVALDLEVTGTALAHRVITNGAVTNVAANHWRVDFPPRFTALSPLVELHAADRITTATRSVLLPVSGRTVTIEASKAVDNLAIDLAAQLTALGTWLAANEADVGPYLHGDRFVVFLVKGGMEYEGGCTSGTASLRHEAFHSWWGRGVKPASQADGWWDEAWTTYHDAAPSSTPYDFSEPPVILCDRNPYARVTRTAAYSSGSRFFRGAAALSTPAALGARMGQFYKNHLTRPATSSELEAHLVAGQSGEDAAVLSDAFGRWVYGLADPSTAPNLWLRDDAAHGGSEQWNGRFWDSPDLWIRNADDGGTQHQEPITGRDNWFHARVRNRGAGIARHFVVTFQVKQYAGVNFTYPADFLPALTAAVGFDLAPAESRVVKARWPAAAVPPVGTHACWLAAAFTRGDHPELGRHVWQHGNLAQKNLTIRRLRLGGSLVVPLVIRNLHAGVQQVLELVRPEGLERLDVGLVRRSTASQAAPDVAAVSRLIEEGSLVGAASGNAGAAPLDDDPERLVGAGFDAGSLLPFPPGRRTSLRIPLPPGQSTLGLLVRAPTEAPVARAGTFDLVARDEQGRIAGGVALELRLEA